MPKFVCRNTRKRKSVPQKYCRGPKPQNMYPIRKCGAKCETASWNTDSWGYCSQTCGKMGIQTRRVTCINHGKIVSNNQCDMDIMPIEEQPCNRHECPGRWRFGDWTQCDKSCGGGTKRRLVECTGSF